MEIKLDSEFHSGKLIYYLGPISVTHDTRISNLGFAHVIGIDVESRKEYEYRLGLRETAFEAPGLAKFFKKPNRLMEFYFLTKNPFDLHLTLKVLVTDRETNVSQIPLAVIFQASVTISIPKLVLSNLKDRLNQYSQEYLSRDIEKEIINIIQGYFAEKFNNHYYERIIAMIVEMNNELKELINKILVRKGYQLDRLHTKFELEPTYRETKLGKQVMDYLTSGKEGK
jgi:hypothetical protein